MCKVLVLAAVILAVCMPALADEAQKAQLGKDDFVSGAINDVFTKIGQYTSGEKDIMIEDYANQPDNGSPAAAEQARPKSDKARGSGAHW